MEFKKVLKQLDNTLKGSSQFALSVSAGDLDTQSALVKDAVATAVVATPEIAPVLSKMQDAILDTQTAIAAQGGMENIIAGIEKAYNVDMIDRQSAVGAMVNDTQKVTLMVNACRTNQNEFAEEFYPSISTVDGGNQIKLQYIAAGFITNWSNGNKEITPAFKMLKDTSFLQGLNHRLYPIYDAASSLIIPELKYVEQNGTKKIETAPYVFNKQLDLLDICTDEVATSGSINNVRTISPTLKLDKVFFTNADKSEKMVFKVNSLKNSAFTATIIGKIEDIQVNFGVNSTFRVPLAEYKKANGELVLPSHANTVVEFAMVITGHGNLTRAQLTMQQPSFVIKSIIDNGVTLASDAAAYTTIVDAIKDIVPSGFSLELYEANGDLFNEGTLLTLDNDSEVFNIGYKEPFTIKGPIAQLYNPTITDLDVLAKYITHFGDKVSAAAVTKLLAALESTEAAAASGEQTLAGIGNTFVKPSHVKLTVDMAVVVNNMESTNKEASVKAAMLSSLKTACAKLYNASGYKAVYNRVNPGRKLRFSVGIGEQLATFLPEGEYVITDEIVMNVVSTPDIRMNEKVIFAFTANGDRNKEIDLLGLGFCGYAPTVVAEVKKTIGNSVVSMVAAFPTYEHVTLTNVMGEIKIANFDKLFIGA